MVSCSPDGVHSPGGHSISSSLSGAASPPSLTSPSLSYASPCGASRASGPCSPDSCSSSPLASSNSPILTISSSCASAGLLAPLVLRLCLCAPLVEEAVPNLSRHLECQSASSSACLARSAARWAAMMTASVAYAAVMRARGGSQGGAGRGGIPLASSGAASRRRISPRSPLSLPSARWSLCAEFRVQSSY